MADHNNNNSKTIHKKKKINTSASAVATATATATEDGGDDTVIPGLPEDMALECLLRASPADLPSLLRVSRAFHSRLSHPSFHLLRRSLRLSRHLLALLHPSPHPANLLSLTPSLRLSLLDPSSSSSFHLPPPPRSLPLFCQLAAVPGHLLVLGGWDPMTWNPTAAVLIYDLLSGNWREGSPIPSPPSRSFFACASSDRGDPKVFIAGGHDEEKNALRSAFAYDVSRDEWTRLPDMARERDECKGVFQGGRFRVIGGYGTDDQGRFGRSSEAFDVDTWRWEPVEEEALEAGACPRTCTVGGGEDRLFRCRGGSVAAAEGGSGGWRDVAEIPRDARVTPCAVGWGEGVAVLGVARHGDPLAAHVLEAGKGGREYVWRKVRVPKEFSGHVQGACLVEI